MKYVSGGKVEKYAGNNYFTLSTNGTTLVGLLKEMPSFGLSTEWETAPIGELGNKLTEYFCSDKMQVASFIFNNDNYKNQISIDQWTSRMYKNTSSSDITLNFRIYAENGLGQSSATEWLGKLRENATINSSNAISSKVMLENIKNTLKAAEKDGGKALVTLLTGGQGKEREKHDKAETLRICVARIAEGGPNWVSEYRQKIIATYSSYTIGYADKNTDSSKIVGNKKFSASEFYRHLDITLDKWNSTNDDDVLEHDYECSVSYLNNDGNPLTEQVDKNCIDKDTGLLSADDIINGLKDENSSWKNNNAFNQKLQEEFLRGAIEYINTTKQMSILSYNEDLEKVKEATRAFKDVDNQIYATDDRVDISTLGSRLWKLKLFPFIFKKPLIVYVSNWSCTPSKEMWGSAHVYYDFSVTCKLDQVNTAKRWYGVFNAK